MEHDKQAAVTEHDKSTGPEQGLRSGSTAGDSHGATDDAPEDSSGTVHDEDSGLTPGERRKELLKEE